MQTTVATLTQPFQTSGHIEQEALIQFVLGLMSEDASVAVRAHLNLCDVCFGRAAILAAHTHESDATMPPEDPRPLGSPATRQFGSYRAESVLGQGGMGIVYKAVHATTGAAVALKTVNSQTVTRLQGLRAEVEALRTLAHPGIVRVLDYDVDDDVPWFAMELLTGRTLADVNIDAHEGTSVPPRASMKVPAGTRKRNLESSLTQTLRLFREICEPLAYLHSRGLVHCDLKPTNVFLREDGSPILTDFGLVAVHHGLEDRDAVVVVDRCRGTLPYLSPEVIRGQIPDARADIYSFGCMLYEALTGRPPFLTWDARELLQLQVHNSHAPASDLVEGLPTEVDALLNLLLAKEPSARPSDARSVARHLSALLREPFANPEVAASLTRPSMVGRELPRQVGSTLVKALAGGSGGTLWVEGESGIGKTFLASEIAQEAARASIQILVGTCALSAEGLPETLSSFQPLFRLMADIHRERGLEDFLSPQQLGVLAPWSASLSRLSHREGIPPALELPENAARERLVETLLHVVRALSHERGLLVVVDDFQWADDITTSVVTRLQDYATAAPLALVLTCRSEELSTTARRLAEAATVRKVALGRLDLNDVHQMAREMLVDPLLVPAATESVFVESEGHPLYATELLRELAAGGINNSQQPLTVEATTFPERLRRLIERRLRLLPEDSYRLLRQAAVLGRHFDPHLLQVAGQVTEVALNASLEVAVQRCVLEDPQTGESRFSFVHDKFREVLLGTLSVDSELTALHRRAAEAYETAYATADEPNSFHLAAMARHFSLAGETDKALLYLPKAAGHALSISAHAEALQLFREALALEERSTPRMTLARRAALQRGVGDALFGLSRSAESALALSEAAKTLGYPVPPPGLRLGLDIVRQLFFRLLPATWRIPRNRDERLELARVLVRLTEAAYLSGDGGLLVRSCLAALNGCEGSGAPNAWTTAQVHWGLTLSVTPAGSRARRWLAKAKSSIAASHDVAAESHLCMALGMYLSGQCELRAARNELERGIVSATAAGHLRRRDECVAIRAGVELFGGLPREAQPWIAQLKEHARVRQDRQLQTWAIAQQMDMHLMQGQYAVALELSEQHRDTNGLPAPDRIWLGGFVASAQLHMGRPQEALQTARAVVELGKRVPPVYSYCLRPLARTCQVLASLALVAPEAQRAETWRLAETALSFTRAHARTFPVGMALAALCAGHLAQSKGHQGRARRHWRAGLTLAQERDLPYEEASLLRALSMEPEPGQAALQERFARISLSHGYGWPSSQEPV